MMRILVIMHKASDIDNVDPGYLPFIGPWSHCPVPRIRFAGKTTNFIPCKCILPRGEKTCVHTPVFPRITTVKGEA